MSRRLRYLIAISAILSILWIAGLRSVAIAESPDQASGFGPLIHIEAVEVTGNSATASSVIRAALPIAAGDTMRAGSSRLEAARYRVLALGFFRKVSLSLARGTERGHVVLIVHVEERGTIALNRLFFGNSQITPWWAGLDLTERNFAGTGLAVGGAFVVAGEGKAVGSRAQHSAILRVADSAFFATRYGWQASIYGVTASEPYRASGEADDGRARHFEAFDYRRLGGRAALSSRLGSLARLNIGGRAEQVRADLPGNAIQTFPDGTMGEVDLHLQDGNSEVLSLFASYDRDTRADPVLPYRGDRLLLHGEVGEDFFVGDYRYLSLRAKYQRWWPVSGIKHVVSAHLSGGAVFGDAPLFERIHVGDLNRMVTGRALGIVTGATPSLDILGLSTDELSYGELGGLAEVQYSYKLFRSDTFVYGGEIFVGAGLWSLVTTADVESRDSLPIDLLLDAGLRFDTEIGIFELSIANGLGRLPL